MNASKAACGLALLLLITASTRADDLLDQLKKLDATVLATDDASRKAAQRMLPDRAARLLREANQASTKAWQKIKSREEWEVFRKDALAAIKVRVSGQIDTRKAPEIHASRELRGEGFLIRNIAFASRENFYITANLYVPDPLPASAPGIIIHPSHHNPKTQGELQDMGMTWARAGCYVLVMDQVGHGERRAHPFATEQDYAKPFRASRQDYFFRYNTGMQLHLIGDSLTGWQVHDLRTGVDVLLARKNIDPKRIIMMGSVAGGGDPVAVAAALDERIACAVVFNFGGPQPESKYPLPDNAEETFGYAGSGSWESTRNLSFSAREGFLPWAIVGSIAPRKLIHAHEFVWDRERDPVWKRLQTIYGWYDAKDHLAFAHGYGLLSQSSDKASHCNNIGPPHRKHIHAALKQWFNIPVPEKEYTTRRPSADLLVMTAGLAEKLKPRKLHEATATGARPPAAPPRNSAEVKFRRNILRQWWDAAGEQTRLLVVTPRAELKESGDDKLRVIKGFIELSPDRKPSFVLLIPGAGGEAKVPLVVMVAQAGKQELLKARVDAIAELLKAGVAVCLAEVSGTGESRLDTDRGRRSWDTGVSSSLLMAGQPALTLRSFDLSAVIAVCGATARVDSTKVAIWGDSLVSPNAPGRDVRVPHDAGDMPAIAEPLGPTLALLAALHEEKVRLVYARGGLISFRSILDSEFVYIPHDMIVPGALGRGDLPAIIGTLARPVRLEGMVTGLNQLASREAIDKEYGPALAAYKNAGAEGQLRLAVEPEDPVAVAKWIAAELKAAR